MSDNIYLQVSSPHHTHDSVWWGSCDHGSSYGLIVFLLGKQVCSFLSFETLIFIYLVQS